MPACFTDYLSLCRSIAAIGYFFLFLFSFFITISAACFNGNCQVLDSCSQATDCGPGLYCGNCPTLGKTQPFCTRGQAIIPTSVIGGLPFNKYSWLMTHNSFSIVDAPSLQGVQRLTFYNQEDTVTNQLMNGVRGLMLDMYDFNGEIWLCHSFRGQCFNFTAFQPAINTLREVEAFLSQNPSEIVTIIIEDYVHTPKGLSNLFTSAGLDKYWFPVSKMPKKGEDWPTVNEMVQANHRLLVFTSVASKEAEEGIAYQWKYILENEAGDPGVKPGSCPKRKESRPLNSKRVSLFLMNYFPTYPVENEACKEHSAPLADMIGTCFKAAGSMLPNFIAVNFYMRSDGGGVFYDLDSMNGQRLCGCNTIAACQAGAPFGSCKNISMPSSSPMTSTGGSFSGSVQFSKSASAVSYPNRFVVGLFSIPCMLFLL
ncbi:PI-PLC X domain-containing protein [Hibiscus syriacus]|uniref:PI-PLC X domain-containing protein n=1 Tax=Hibiscus syriacus TaxID=106335 RepID=A0A6A2WPJ8_HIBSY|nr:PI-PLC X domain-containing protein At5g67130-like isoform X2 [Hibiscus syriacus]KAE8656020.1 PI-PLC X domain-containing protein [Hibiscus syriacus]